MKIRYYILLRNGRYLSAPPVEGKRLSTCQENTREYDFGTAAARIARDIKGAQVVSHVLEI